MAKVSELMSNSIEWMKINKQTWSIFYNMKEYGAKGNGVKDDLVTLQAIINKLNGEDGVIIFPKGDYRIASNIIIPSNVFLYFVGEGFLVPDNDVTITIHGGIIAGPYQIFKGDGNTNGSKAIVDYHYSEWWGAKGDGVTDDTTAIIKTVNMANNSTILFFNKTYKVTLASLLNPLNSTVYKAEGTLSKFLYNGQLYAIPLATNLYSNGDNKVVVSIGGNVKTIELTSTELLNMRDEFATFDARLDTLIQGGGPDKDLELVDIRTPVMGYVPDDTIHAAGDMTRDMQKKIVDGFAEVKSDVHNIPVSALNQIKNERYIFNGDITTFTRSIVLRSSRVVFWGDSITEHSSATDVSTKYTSIIEQKLREKFNDVDFNFYNRGIGGTTLNNAVNDSYVPSEHVNRPWTIGNTKSWRTVIKELEPDLLFVAFGMNNQSGFAVDYDSLFSFINTFNKKPTVVLVSTPLPSIDYQNGNAQLGNARVTREKSKQYNAFCMDVGRNSRLAVRGKDEYNFISEKIEGFDNFESLDESITKSNNSVTFTINNRYIRSLKKMYNFKINLTCNFSNQETLRIEMRNSRNIVLFQGERNKVEYYPVSGTMQSSYSKTLTGTMSLSLECVGSDINIYFNDVLEHTFKHCYSDMADGEIYICANGSMLPLNISDVSIISYEPINVMPIANDEDIFGEYKVGDSSTQMPFGGNGMNHPTSIGTALLYLPQINEFIKYADEQLRSTQKWIIPVKKLSSSDFNATGSTFPTHNSLGTPMWFVYLTITNIINEVVFLREILSYTYLKRNNTILTKENLINLKNDEFIIFKDNSNIMLIIAKDLKSNIPDLELSCSRVEN